MTPTPNHGRTTDPKLLKRVGDWRDAEAWTRFVSHYEPHLRAVCFRYGLVGDAADECCQRVWIELASAMRKFRYDPGRRFRGWLHLFFQSRIKDVLKASQAHVSEGQIIEDLAVDLFVPGHDDGEPCDPEIVAMLRQAEVVQDAVRARVTPDNWEVFRLVGIEGWLVADAARFLEREYTTVYRSYKRVSRMVDNERRRQTGLADETSVRS